MTAGELEAILESHAAWLRDQGGSQADLRGSNLRGSNLSWANLIWANLRGADLRGADLSESNLSWANLRGADLSGADLSGADLRGADLSESNLRWANLSWADLRGADLRGADLSGADLCGATIRNGLKLGRAIGHASRGIDSYTFFAFECDAGETYFIAGCRSFLRSEFEAHIEAEYPDTDKAKRTCACLDYLESLK